MSKEAEDCKSDRKDDSGTAEQRPACCYAANGACQDPIETAISNSSINGLKNDRPVVHNGALEANCVVGMFRVEEATTGT